MTKQCKACEDYVYGILQLLKNGEERLGMSWDQLLPQRSKYEHPGTRAGTRE